MNHAVAMHSREFILSSALEKHRVTKYCYQKWTYFICWHRNGLRYKTNTQLPFIYTLS